MVRMSDEMEFDPTHMDLSVVPSFRCNLSCPFCMYECGPLDTRRLDIEMFKTFLGNVEWSLVRNMGFYGGEPSIETDLYQQFIDLVPKEIPKFTITNGSWSIDWSKRANFMTFCKKNGLRVFVSSMPEHRKHQFAAVLATMAKAGEITIKEPDIIHPMGRAARPDWKCNYRCQEHLSRRGRTRVAIIPGGDVIFQSCDGVYPVVGNYTHKLRDIFEIECKLIESAGCR